MLYKSCIKCRRIKKFENPLVESLWFSVRPISLTSLIGKVMNGFTSDSLLCEVSGKFGTKQFAVWYSTT